MFELNWTERIKSPVECNHEVFSSFSPELKKNHGSNICLVLKYLSDTEF